MKKILLISFLVISFSLNAQQIQTEKVFGGYKFTQNNQSLSHEELTDIMKNNQQAFDLMESAKSNKIWSSIVGGIGGALIGFPIGTAIGGGDPEWTLAAVGAGFIAIGIPISNGYNRKTLKAVELYNQGFKDVSFQFQPEFNLNLKGSTIGISMSF